MNVHVREIMTHPAFTFVSNAPSIHSKPTAIGLHPWPLYRHIASTHQRLPNVVKAVEHMIFGWLQQDVVDLLRVVLPYQSLKGECCLLYTSDAADE